MTVVWATLRKELVSYLFSPIGYLIAVLFYLFRGIEVASVVKRVAWFGGDVDQFATAYVLQLSSLLLIAFVPPILTMRTFAEERRSGSLEVLMTAPVRAWEIVIGKWGAAVVFFLLLWGPTLPLLWVLGGESYLADRIPFSTVVAGYLGVALVGTLVLAVGCFTSSLTDNVLLASLSSMLFGFALVFGQPLALPHVAPYLGEHPWLATLLGQLDVIDQLGNGFARGLIDSKNCVFYLAGTACFLFLTERALEFRRLPRAVGRGVLVAAGLVAILLWGGLTLLGSRPAVRGLIDVSPQAQFTFSDETVALLGDLEARDVELEIDTFYAPLPRPSSDDPEQARIYQLHLRIQQLTTDLLRLFQLYGGDHVRVTHHDVLQEVKAARAKREEYGLQTPNSLVVKVGKRHKELSLDLDLAVIDYPATRRTPAPGAQQRLASLELYKGEEAIASAIRSLLVEGTPRAYFLTGYGDVTIKAGVADSYSELVGALMDDGFEVLEWPLGEHGFVPEDADVVALMEPRYELPERDAEALVAYVRSGGRLFVDVSFRELPVEHNPTLAALGSQLGFELGTELVAHLVPDPRMPEAPGRGGVQAQTLRTVLDPRHPITRPLVASNRGLVLKAAREIRARGAPPDGIRVDLSLVRTGPWAWLARRRESIGREVDFSAPAQREAYAARCVGAVVDVAPDSGTRTGHVVLVGGIAFINAAGGFEINGDFALNAFNWMASRSALVTVRGNRYASRRLELVPQQVERVDRLLIWYVPGALLVFACLVFWRRRRS